MKAVILAAGYATRLYPLTINTAKPLLQVGGQPMINYIVNKIETIPEISEIFVVTNNKFYSDFTKWNINSNKSITIINDGTLSNDDRLGAVGDLDYVIHNQSIDEDLLVIAGDNLFGFSLPSFVNFFQTKQSSIVACHDLYDKNIVRGKYGVAILNQTKVIDFEEKPEEPKSTMAATACYIFRREDLQLIEQHLHGGKFDNPGDLIKFLSENSNVHGFIFDDHWFDIGSFEGLEEARRVYEN